MTLTDIVMDEMFSRTARLIGTEAVEQLSNSSVMVVGVGGVGSFIAEALCRAGIGRFVLIDSDRVDITNLNRQIEATRETVGSYKCDAMRARLLSINPAAEIECRIEHLEADSQPDFSGIDYIADAIDCMSAKLMLVSEAAKANIPIISCMGTGNKLDPSLFQISDISKTHTCPLCRAMRRGLKEKGLTSLKVCWSPEQRPEILKTDPCRAVPASISFVPSSAGLLIASAIVRDLIDAI